MALPRHAYGDPALIAERDELHRLGCGGCARAVKVLGVYMCPAQLKYPACRKDSRRGYQLSKAAGGGMSARPGRLERRLDDWARWVVSHGQESGAPSLLARWMDGKGHIVFGGGSSEPADVIETLIEAAVLKMATENPLQADILRLEFAAGCYGVAQRRGIKGYDPRNMNQTKHALALGMSVRTYRTRLAEAKHIVNEALNAALSPKGIVMNALHPLFGWMNPYPDLVTIQQLTDYARGLGFAALAVTKRIPLGLTLAQAALVIIDRVEVEGLAQGHKMAGCWSDSPARQMTLLYVRPLTDTARALWLLSDSHVLSQAMARLTAPRASLCPPYALTHTIRQNVYHSQGCRPLAVKNAPWVDLEPCLAALMDAFQVTAIDPLEAA